MKQINKKTAVLSMILASFGIGATASSNPLKIENPNEMILEICNGAVKNIGIEKIKENELDKCVFSIDQQFKQKEIESKLKKIKQDKETISQFKIDGIKSYDLLVETLKSLRQAMLLPEGKTAEYERIGSLYKDPNIDIKDKEKEAKEYYSKFNEKNYKVSEDVYKAFRDLNLKLVAQKEKVIAIESILLNNELEKLAFMEGVDVKSITEQMKKDSEKKQKQFEKAFTKQLEINNAILADYNTFLMARQLEAKDTLNKIVEEKKIKLTKKECELMNVMYKTYELNNFKNLTCK